MSTYYKKMGKNKKTFEWQGEEVKVKFGLALTKTNKDKPLYWYNYEVSLEETIMQGNTLISAIQIETSRGSKFVISNHFGIGVHKVLNGGYPNIQHFSFSDDVEFKEHPEYETYDGEFQLEEFEEHESNRRKWQKENFPVEFDNSERLRKLIIKT